jgi:hypothetical protein
MVQNNLDAIVVDPILISIMAKSVPQHRESPDNGIIRGADRRKKAWYAEASERTVKSINFHLDWDLGW